MKEIQKFIDLILATLFPDYCIGCSKINTLLCSACLDSIPKARETEYSFINPLFDYRSPVIKKAVWRLKYNNTQRAARYFARPLYEEAIGVSDELLSSSEQEKILLVDIPLHKNRLRERGYNQSALLVQAILSQDTHHTFEHIPNILTRTRATKTQARFEKRSARLNNLKDAFVCTTPNLVRGRTIILIDDVTTTGATLNEARRVLTYARPRSVAAITLAH